MVSDDLLVLNNKDTLHTQKCGQIFQSFCKPSFKPNRFHHQALPVLKSALPFSHKLFSNTFHADNLGSGLNHKKTV